MRDDARRRSTARSPRRCSTGCAAPAPRRRGRGSGRATRCAGSGSPTTSRRRVEDEARAVDGHAGRPAAPDPAGHRQPRRRRARARRVVDLVRRGGVREGAARGAARPRQGVSHRRRPRARTASATSSPGRSGRDRPVGRLLPATGDLRAARRRARDRRGPCRPSRSSCTRRSPSRRRSRCGRSRSRPQRADAPLRPTGRARRRRAAPRRPTPGGRRSEPVRQPGTDPARGARPAQHRRGDGRDRSTSFEVGRAGERGSSCHPACTSSGTSGPERTIEQRRPIALAAGETRAAGGAAGTEPSPATLELLEAMGGTRGRAHTVELTGASRCLGADVDARRDGPRARAQGEKRGTPSLGLRAAARLQPDAGRAAGIAVYVVSEDGRARPGRDRDPGLGGGRGGPRRPRACARADPRLVELVAAARARPLLGLASTAQGRGAADGLRRGTCSTTASRRSSSRSPRGSGSSSTSRRSATATRRRPRPCAASSTSSACCSPGRLDGACELVARARGGRRGRPVRRLPLRLCPAPARAAGRARERSRRPSSRTAPQLTDGFVLRGEYAAAAGASAAKQAFAEAVGRGRPALRRGADAAARRPPRARHPATRAQRSSATSSRTTCAARCGPSAHRRQFEPGRLLVTAARPGLRGVTRRGRAGRSRGSHAARGPCISTPRAL